MGNCIRHYGPLYCQQFISVKVTFSYNLGVKLFFMPHFLPSFSTLDFIKPLRSQKRAKSVLSMNPPFSPWSTVPTNCHLAEVEADFKPTVLATFCRNMDMNQILSIHMYETKAFKNIESFYPLHVGIKRPVKAP